MFTPSKYQSDIYQWVQSGSGDCVVQATAGSGKTSTLVEVAKQLHTENAIFLAFNKHIVEELQRRLPEKMAVKTIHSVGYGALMKTGKKFKSPNDTKYRTICKDIAVDIKYETKADVDSFILSSELLKVANFARLTLIDYRNSDKLWEMIDHFGIDITEPGFVLPYVGKVIEEGNTKAKYAGEIDFTDMIWLPYAWNLYPKQYEFVLADEAQDFSEAQLQIAMKCRGKGGRMLFVGDSHQCQPPGTLVTLSDLTQTPIENLRLGDFVVTYDRKGSAFIKKCKINEVASRDYTGYLYSIAAKDKCSKSTDSHKWIVRWINTDATRWVTYLMRKGTKFRVGLTSLFNNRGDFGLGNRLSTEQADAAWILSTHENLQDALAHEQIVSAKFGLPEVTFRQATGNIGQTKMFTQEVIDKIFDELHPQIDCAIRCLNAHGKKIEYPLLSKENAQQRRGRMTVFETQACNLISGFMAVPISPDKIVNPSFKQYKSVPQWEEITVDKEWYEGIVYSLDVDRYHKYIADGIVTCNSIMAFAGANNDSLDKIIKATNATVLPLSICYRCPTSHIVLAQKIVPEIEAAPNAIEGIVDVVNEKELHFKIQEGDLIICRMTAPLVSMCIELIAKKIPARVKGRDISKQLTLIVDDVSKMPGFKYDDFGIFLADYENIKVAKLRQRENPEALIEQLEDRCAGVLACFESFDCKDVQCLSREIEDLFSDARASVTLSTVHRCKGLENKRVFILKPEKLPLRWKGQKGHELVQEYNLKFVALSRAKEFLFFVEEAEKKADKKEDDIDF